MARIEVISPDFFPLSTFGYISGNAGTTAATATTDSTRMYGDAGKPQFEQRARKRSIDDVFIPAVEGRRPVALPATQSKRIITELEREFYDKLVHGGPAGRELKAARSLMDWLYVRMQALMTIRSPTYCTVMGCAVQVKTKTSATLILVSEVMETNLSSYIAAQKGGAPSLESSLKIVCNLAKALSNLHSVYLRGESAYGVLSASNVLLDSALNVKLSPHGLTDDPSLQAFIAGATAAATADAKQTTEKSTHGMPLATGGAQATVSVRRNVDYYPPATRQNTIGGGKTAPALDSQYHAVYTKNSDNGVQGGSISPVEELRRMMYKAPEILIGGAATEHSDVYALGMIMFQTLLG